MSKTKHPIQPTEVDGHGVLRFKKNPIVDFLVEQYGLNALRNTFSDQRYGSHTEDDWDQLNQLQGYSVSGCPLSDETIRSVATASSEGECPKDAMIKELQRQLKEARDGMRIGVASLFEIHPDDLKE